MSLSEQIGPDFRGCCQITEHNKIVFSQASGFADLANKISNTLETKFATASAGKVFVAVAILQFIETGDLQFQDTLGNLLPLHWNQIDPGVTVEQLLTHTSGVPDYFDEGVMDEYEALWANFPNYNIRTNADLLPLFIHKPMMYPKGETFQYNNTGFVLLAMIIEQKTGEPFDKYLKAHIFDPCNMVSTGYYELDRLPPQCANHYIYDQQHKDYRTNIYSVDVKGTGAGGAFTTVGDIASFWTHLLSNKLLSAEMTGQMLRCHSGNEEAGYYGYGIWLKKTQDGSFSPYIQGCDPGVSFLSAHDLKREITVTLVSNYCDNVWSIMRGIREQIFTQ